MALRCRRAARHVEGQGRCEHFLALDEIAEPHRAAIRTTGALPALAGRLILKVVAYEDFIDHGRAEQAGKSGLVATLHLGVTRKYRNARRVVRRFENEPRRSGGEPRRGCRARHYG